jgi:sugar lactone lactonase YvrE
MGIAVDSQDFVYVADTWNHRIQKFTSEGKFIMLWGKFGEDDGEVEGANAIAIDSEDNVYVASIWGIGRIQKYTPDGKFITKLGKKGRRWEDEVFRLPSGIAIDSNGYVYVSDLGDKRIQIFKKK